MVVVSYYLMVGELYVSYVDGNEYRVIDGTGYSDFSNISGVELDRREKKSLNPKQAKSVKKFLDTNNVGNVKLLKVETPTRRISEVTEL